MSNPLNLNREREDQINQEFLRQYGHPYADYYDPTYPGESYIFFDDKPYPAKKAPRNERGTFSQAVHLDEFCGNTGDQWERPVGMGKGSKDHGYRGAYRNTNTGEQRFFCDCGKIFSNASHRKRHEQTEHGMKWD
jgi:hypothetical protein